MAVRNRLPGLGALFMVGGLLLMGGISKGANSDGAFYESGPTNGVLVVGVGGRPEARAEAEAPGAMKECLSEVVEKFLRHALRQAEDEQTPQRYSDFIYILPGDDLGLIERTRPPRVAKPEEVPPSIRRWMER